MGKLLHLVTANDDDIGVRVDDAKQTLADKLDSLSVVTSYAHALLNTTINPVSSPPETWFGPLNDNLNIAKGHALTWIKDVAPKIGGTIPQSIIDYNNVFMETSAEILKILAKPSLSQADTNQIIELIDATLDTVLEQKSQVKSVQDLVNQLVTDFEADHGRLATGQNSAAAAVKLADDERIAIEGKIGELQTKLAEARSKVTVSGIGLGLAIFVAVAAFALAAVTGGAGLVVVGAVGVIGVGAAATFTGIFSAEVTSLLREIAAQQSALEAKKRQITALTGLVDTINSLKTKNEDAKKALTSISTMWTTLGGKLDAVLRALKAGKEAPDVVLQRVKIGTARTSWTQTAEWAEKIQALSSGTTVQPVIQDRSVYQAYA